MNIELRNHLKKSIKSGNSDSKRAAYILKYLVDRLHIFVSIIVTILKCEKMY